MRLTDAATELLSAGINITLVNANKQSTIPWKEFQSRMITPDEIEKHVQKASGIAIICGSISGGIEVIDVDCKYDLSGTLFDSFMSNIPEQVRNKLVVATTRSNGYHIYYRCPEIGGNTKLAQRPATDQELSENPHAKVFVLIETRGTGGYVVAPPTQGYKWITGDYSKITTLTPHERDQLITAARMMNAYHETPVRHERLNEERGFQMSPFEDYNLRGDVLSLLYEHGWTKVSERGGKTFLRRPGKTDGTSGDYWHDKRWFGVFSTSTEFEVGKAYNPSAVLCKLKFNNNWKECAKHLIEQGYGERKNPDYLRSVEILEYELLKGTSKSDIQNIITKQTKLTHEQAGRIIEGHANVGSVFWTTDRRGSIKINRRDMLAILQDRFGYGFYQVGSKPTDLELIRVVDGLVEHTSIERIKKSILEIVKDYDDVHEAILVGHSAYFNDGLNEFMDVKDLDFVSDDANTANFYFRNGIVRVTAESIQMVSYKECNKHIWRSALRNVDVKINEVSMFNAGEGRAEKRGGGGPRGGRRSVGEEAAAGYISFTQNDEFANFIYNISGQNDTNFDKTCQHIGYNLHKYKDPSRPYATILAEDSDEANKGGGTGKGLLVTALSHMVKVDQIDGKNFRHDKPFKYQRVAEDTNLIAMQDVRSKLDFESLYSQISEGLTVERKNQPEIFIPYSRSPKFIITTNYMVNDDGNHAARRQRVIPFSNYYGLHRTPIDEFKHRFFDDWDEVQWTSFYNFMFACTQMYLATGLSEIEKSDNMRFKTIRSQYGDEIADWWVDQFERKQDRQLPYASLYDEFVRMTDVDQKFFSKKKFTAGLKKIAEIFQVEITFYNNKITNQKEVSIIFPKS